MGTLSDSVGRANNNLSNDAKVNKPSQSSDSHSGSPLLSIYDRDELIARQNNLIRLEQDLRLEITTRERKVYADLLVNQFELTGSDLAADANPRQMHLF